MDNSPWNLSESYDAEPVEPPMPLWARLTWAALISLALTLIYLAL
jgi:hypothetical protein